MADPITTALLASVIGSLVEGWVDAPPVEAIQQPGVGMVRTLPDKTTVGVMQPPRDGQVVINGKVYPLSASATVRNELNMMLPPMMVQKPVMVRFMTDLTGAVNRIWILTAAEVAALQDK